MPEVVAHLLPPAHLVKVGRGETAQRKPLQPGAAGEQHDQQHGKQEVGDGVANDNDTAAPDVERRAIPNRLANTERNRHQVADQRGPEAEGDRHRQLLDDQVDHPLVAVKALAKIKQQIVAQHLQKALVGRLVEAVEPFDLRDQGRVQPLCATVAAIFATRGDVGLDPAADAVARVHANPLEVGDGLLHRAAGGELNQKKVEQQYPQQGGDDQQHTAEDIGGHQGLAHQVSRPRS